MSVLYVIATPIGNLGDMTPRGVETLRQVDVLACEDTRHTGNLLKLLDIPRPPIVVSNHEHNERAMASRLVAFLDDGKTVGLCSDAGYPVLSDPGYPAVAAAVAAGHEVQVIPGANALLSALICSGLPCSSFTFKGFAPRKPGKRRTFLEMDRELPHTLIFYESPYRVADFLKEAQAVFGDRPAAVCLELTKQFERIQRGSLGQLAEAFSGQKVKGEAVIVVAGQRRTSASASTDDDEAESLDN